MFEWWGTASVAGSWSENRRDSERVVGCRRRCEMGHLRSWIMDCLLGKREEEMRLSYSPRRLSQSQIGGAQLMTDARRISGPYSAVKNRDPHCIT